MKEKPHIIRVAAAASLLWGAGCATTETVTESVTVHYVGSSTVAVFLSEAESVYPGLHFDLDTAPESAGGERAIFRGEARLAGIATHPSAETLNAGIASTLVGRDAIAVVVHPDNPVEDLSRDQLRALFRGEITDWSQVGGPELAVTPFVVAPDSATHTVFQREVLGGQAYGEGCQVARPDRGLIELVARTPGGIGHISFGFLHGEERVRPIAVDGERPTVTNFEYPIARPLYLLHRPGDPALDGFLEWVDSSAGQRVVMRHFVGKRVVGEVGATEAEVATGTLIVYTRREPVYDGGIYYYPYTAYEVRKRYGELFRRVPNRRGHNDERPTRVELPADTYLVVAESAPGEKVEFFVRIEAGRVTEADVEEILEERR